MDKASEQKRTRSVKNLLAKQLESLGFQKGSVAGTASIKTNDYECHVSVQKFRHMPEFRVHAVLSKNGEVIDHLFSDSYTRKNPLQGYKYDFNIRWEENAVERCLYEIQKYVENIILPWAVENSNTQHPS